MLIQKNKVIGIWFNNQYLKLRNLKSYFIKSNISTFSDFELFLFSTVIFATLKTSSERNRVTGLVPAKYTGTEPVPAPIPLEPVPDRTGTGIAVGS